MESKNLLNVINKEKIIAVIRTKNKDDFIDIVNILKENNIKIIEVTLTTPNSFEIIKELSQYDDLIIGAGTVLDSSSANLAIQSGAQFIVSPAFDKLTAEFLNIKDVPYIPGCMTVKEMIVAYKYGCKVLKLFPASQFNTGAIKDIKGPLPNLEFIPTGGININNFKDWLSAGSYAVGLGGEITKIYKEKGKEHLSAYLQKLVGKM
ncbi:bifunctional 4-hydroxy-2-oxoglutarate aldolase/2-dehydro-3-deoxy-phosphogluconate aldolase [Mammaliicoccus lentus]|uniref:bifunctional 4-hydroxy-2-oxoglutarate aldolase/2-dehydro-3-deoxy-phosphogluconate aldolase n=1 Tax=Mammaliicoccus lentus TaxID=42858 RepID=UPI003F544086